MINDDVYAPGTPCWVDSLQPDPRTALRFYGPLFGWSFDDPTPMPGGLDGEYFAARLRGRLVTGIGQAPESSPAVWSTYVRVEEIEETIAHAQQAGGTLLAGPMDAGLDGRLAVLVDATGVAVCLWQAGQRVGAEITGEHNTWAMSSLHTTDPQRANAFYAALFGWTIEPVAGAAFSQWWLSDRIVAVVSATDGVAVPPHWSVSFTVGDADATAEHAVALGGGVLMAPTDTPGFRSAVIADPQGGVIAISAPAH